MAPAKEARCPRPSCRGALVTDFEPIKFGVWKAEGVCHLCGRSTAPRPRHREPLEDRYEGKHAWKGSFR